MASPISEAPGKGRTIPSVIENGAAPIPRYLSINRYPQHIHVESRHTGSERATGLVSGWSGLNGDDMLANHGP